MNTPKIQHAVRLATRPTSRTLRHHLNRCSMTEDLLQHLEVSEKKMG